MCFRNYVLQRTWLDKCLKSPVQNTVRHAIFYRVLNTAESCTMALLSNISITLREMGLENFSVSNI